MATNEDSGPEAAAVREPSKAPGSRTVRWFDTGGQSLLRHAARRAREHPKTWVFVGTSTMDQAAVERGFVREVIDGEKVVLGPGEWDATTERGVVRDGEPVILAGAPPEPGEQVVTLKFIAFCGGGGADA